jgi:hypothetical protein
MLDIAVKSKVSDLIIRYTASFVGRALCANMSETTLLQKLVYNVGAEETKQ